MAPATGRPRARGLIFATRANPNTMGARMMKPTSKKTGMPSTKAAAVTAATTRFGPRTEENFSARASAPPDTSMSRPSMAPSPTTIMTLARVFPMPAVMVGTMSVSAMPVASAVPKATSSRATNADILIRMTRISSRMMAPRAMPSRVPAPMAQPFFGVTMVMTEESSMAPCPLARPWR